jgi:hypothetical protein
MTLHTKLIPVGVLTAALFAGSTAADAAQRGADRNGSGQAPSNNAQRDDRDERRNDGRATGPVARQRDERNQGDWSANRQRNDDVRNKKQKEFVWRGTPRRYSARPAPRHYYGSGGSYSVFFGFGSGYRYGTPYSGRVYGYAPQVYSGRRVYGDVRLEVRPRNAAVYVDGYYAGVVDNFDGVFQHLTLTVGPHEIEIAAPGLEPRFFDVYIDPARTISLQADLLNYR